MTSITKAETDKKKLSNKKIKTLIIEVIMILVTATLIHIIPSPGISIRPQNVLSYTEHRLEPLFDAVTADASWPARLTVLHQI